MHKIGKQTVCFDNPPIILQTAAGPVLVFGISTSVIIGIIAVIFI